jgi:hypothetical protein
VRDNKLKQAEISQNMTNKTGPYVYFVQGCLDAKTFEI